LAAALFASFARRRVAESTLSVVCLIVVAETAGAGSARSTDTDQMVRLVSIRTSDTTMAILLFIFFFL
jgi:hypothetical protein